MSATSERLERQTTEHPIDTSTMSNQTRSTRDALEASLKDSPFQRLLGLRLESFDSASGTLSLRCPCGPNVERIRGSGQFHGGVIASLVDITADYALMGALGFGALTINFRVDFLRPAVNTEVVARAQVRRLGRKIAVVDVELSDVDGKLIAIGRGTYSTQLPRT